MEEAFQGLDSFIWGLGRNGGIKKKRLSCLMHRIRSYAHTLHRDLENGVSIGVNIVSHIGLWKKLFKGWTASYELFVSARTNKRHHHQLDWIGEVDSGKEDCKQTAQASRLTLVLGQEGSSKVWQPYSTTKWSWYQGSLGGVGQKKRERGKRRTRVWQTLRRMKRSGGNTRHPSLVSEAAARWRGRKRNGSGLMLVS